MVLHWCHKSKVYFNFMEDMCHIFSYISTVFCSLSCDCADSFCSCAFHNYCPFLYPSIKFPLVESISTNNYLNSGMSHVYMVIVIDFHNPLQLWHVVIGFGRNFILPPLSMIHCHYNLGKIYLIPQGLNIDLPAYSKRFLAPQPEIIHAII